MPRSGPGRVTAVLPTDTLPFVAGTRPPITLSKVDLPDPFVPITVTHWPDGIVRSIPRSAGTFRMVQADVMYDVPGLGLTSQQARVDVVLNFVEDGEQAGPLNGRLMNLVERVVAHKLQTQALDEAAAGHAAKATQRLRAAATRLLELGEVDMAQQAEGQAQQLEQKGTIDLAAAQKMRYATKRLTETDLSGG